MLISCYFNWKVICCIIELFYSLYSLFCVEGMSLFRVATDVVCNLEELVYWSAPRQTGRNKIPNWTLRGQLFTILHRESWPSHF